MKTCICNGENKKGEGNDVDKKVSNKTSQVGIIRLYVNILFTFCFILI